MTTEPNALKAMIAPPTVISRLATTLAGTSGVSDSLPAGAVSSMPWRKAGVSYSANEVYVDVVEEVDGTLDAAGRVLTAEVSGSVQVNCRLSGTPDLTLSFADPRLIGDDCSFHPCVRYLVFERDRVLSFVPPDGAFELMRYRVRELELPGRTPPLFSPPLTVAPQISYTESGGGSSGGGSGGYGRVHVSLQLRAPIGQPASNCGLCEYTLLIPHSCLRVVCVCVRSRGGRPEPAVSAWKREDRQPFRQRRLRPVRRGNQGEWLCDERSRMFDEATKVSGCVTNSAASSGVSVPNHDAQRDPKHMLNTTLHQFF